MSATAQLQPGVMALFAAAAALHGPSAGADTAPGPASRGPAWPVLVASCAVTGLTVLLVVAAAAPGALTTAASTG